VVIDGIAPPVKLLLGIHQIQIQVWPDIKWIWLIRSWFGFARIPKFRIQLLCGFSQVQSFWTRGPI